MCSLNEMDREIEKVNEKCDYLTDKLIRLESRIDFVMSLTDIRSNGKNFNDTNKLKKYLEFIVESEVNKLHNDMANTIYKQAYMEDRLEKLEKKVGDD